MQSVCWIVTITLLSTLVGITQSCSCEFMHPQEHFCRADFVIRARVKKEVVQNDTIVYKVRINKQYKITDKALVALKDGRVSTASSDSVCGKSLEVGKVYVISGKIVSLKAKINLCGFNELWQNVSKRQRKGFQKMYKKGCQKCTIRRCYSEKACMKKPKNYCYWQTSSFNNDLDCERIHGICLPLSSGDCAWAKNKMQRMCMTNREKESTKSRRLKKPTSPTHKNQLTISR